MTWKLSVVLPALLVCTLGCNGKKSSDSGTHALDVFVSIPPQAYFVRQIGGDLVKVETLVRPGQNPHNYEPTAKQIARLGKADAYFRIGVPFEQTLMEKLKSAVPDLNVVDTRKGIKLRKMQSACGNSHSCGHSHEEGADPHIWMSPRLAIIQARTICDALKKADPKHAAQYEANYKKFQARLDGLNREIAKKLAPLKGETFFVFHPTFGYFADAYGLKQQAVEIEGKQPSAKQLAELIAKAKRLGVRIIFVQPQFSRKSAAQVAKAIGGAVVPLDSLAENYVANLKHVTDEISKALREEKHAK